MKPIMITKGWNKHDLWKGCIISSIAHAMGLPSIAGGPSAHSFSRVNWMLSSPIITNKSVPS